MLPRHAARAQSPNVAVRTRITDSAGAPIEGVEVTILRGVSEVLGRGLTGPRGDRLLIVPRMVDEYQVVARRIGYKRSERFFVAGARDTVALSIPLSRAPQELAAVAVTAQEDVRRKSYYLDAETIANSGRTLLNGVDLIDKLRPDMLFGRSGYMGNRVNVSIGGTLAPVLNPGETACMLAPLQNVWINGKRIVTAAPKDVAMAKAKKGMGAYDPISSSTSLSPRVLSILAGIHPEHIAEMQYHECSEAKDIPMHGENALFVVLKPGIRWDDVRGTVLAEDATEAAPLPAHRLRILGVFDLASGAPLDSAEVIESASGVRALTTSTGTVALHYLPEGLSTVRVHKAGYTELSLSVSISPRDTTGITVLLERSAATP